jgi:hypothetical protein
MTQSAFDRYRLRRGQPVPPGEGGMIVAEPRPSPGLALERIKHAVRRRIG